jgi:hypothetical protein
MAKTVGYKMAGVKYEMPASYKVAREIGRIVGDPLEMAVKAEKGEIPWTVESVIDIVSIGLKAAGCEMDRDDVADEIIEQGIPGALEAAAQLIGQIVAGGPAKPIRGASGKKR